MLIFFLMWSGATLERPEREGTVLEMEPSGLFLEPGILSKKEETWRGDSLTKATNALQNLSVRRSQNKFKARL